MDIGVFQMMSISWSAAKDYKRSIVNSRAWDIYLRVKEVSNCVTPIWGCEWSSWLLESIPVMGSLSQWLFPSRRKLAFFFFQAEDGIRDSSVTGVQTCALPI